MSNNQKIYKNDGRKYYYKDNWYDAETNIKVPYRLACHLISKFFKNYKKDKKMIKYEKLKSEYPLIHEGSNVYRSISAGSPGLGKRK